MFINTIPRQGGLISSAGGVLLDEGGPNMRNAVDSLLDDVLANIFCYLPA
jgi:hypothetical protein